MTKKKEESYELPNDFKFKFTMVSGDDEKCCECEIQEYLEFKGDYPICAYEKYLYAQYMINSAQDIAKLYTEVIGSFTFQRSSLFWIRRLHRSCIKNVGLIKDYNIEGLEEQIDKIPEIQTLIRNQYKKEGYVCITDKVINGISEYSAAIYAYLMKGIELLKKWCSKQNPNTLKKAFYTEHLHDFFRLANVHNKNVIKLAEYMLLQQVNGIEKHLATLEHRNNEVSPIMAGCKNFKKELLIKYANVLFRGDGIIDCKNVREKYYEGAFLLNTFVYTVCFTPACSKEEFREKCLPIMKKEKLTINDFKHVEQVPYLVALLENALEEKRKGINILLYGKPGTGKTALAKTLIQAVTNYGYEVLNTSWSDLGYGRGILRAVDTNTNYIRIDNFYFIRELLKQNSKSILLYDEAEDFFRKKDDTSQSKGIVNDILENNLTPTIWTMNNTSCMEESYFRRFTYVLNVDELPSSVYCDMIQKMADKYKLVLEDETLNIYTQYKPNLGLIDKTFSNFQLSGYQDQEWLRTNILDALKGQNYGEDLPPLVCNKFDFNPDLVNASIDLKQLTKQIKKNGRLDFGMLLYGVPGSSKSSFGRYLAEQLGLKVICRNYTELASMWVGETEHNIAKLFKDGTADQAVIILDEADVLLRDRTQASRSWEVSQTEALLTEMENYEYPFIMTTNLFESLDAAVMRRFLYKVKHDYLTSEQVKLAFKHFFNITIKEDLHLSRLTSGDFALVKKQAEFQDKLKDKQWLIDRLTEEMMQKKDSISSPSIKF